MKKLHTLILKSYLGPFVMTFFIALFILLMQFVWKYIDDLIGKGLEWHVIVRLLSYASASLVPMALPLAILLSSLMTFGNLGEHYELVACKSAGMSLPRIMLPLIVVSVCISIAAFFFSNNVLPYSNLKMGSLLYDIRQQRPAFSIREGAFYNGIEGYSLRVGKKGKDNKTLYQVMIYDHSQGLGNNKLVTADTARMEMSPDNSEMVLTLYNGYSYEEKENKEKGEDTRPLIRSTFQEETIRFDMSAFRLSRTNEDLFKDNYQMMDIKNLVHNEDSLQTRLRERKTEYRSTLASYYYFLRDTVRNIHDDKAAPAIRTGQVLQAGFDPGKRDRVRETALNLARSAKAYIYTTAEDVDIREKIIIRFRIEWHRKFTLSIACLVLFFIGAPLGAIIRKGGLGLPVVVSALFFIAFHIVSITGEKSGREGVIEPWQGMWFATAVFLPIGVFLTYKATTDSGLFNAELYFRFIRKIAGFFPKKKHKPL